jgi:hypothetical protein
MYLRTQKDVLHFKYVTRSHDTRVCVIYVYKKSTDFPAEIFMKITTAESYCADVLCKLYYPNRKRTLLFW